MGDDDDSPLPFLSPYGPESRTLDEARSGKKNVSFPPVNAEAQEETPLGHGTAFVPWSNGYCPFREEENYAQEHENLKKESTTTYKGENDETIQESEEETNAQGNNGLLQPPNLVERREMVENNEQDNSGALEQEEKQREGKRCEDDSVKDVLTPPSVPESIEKRGDGKTSSVKYNSKPNVKSEG